MSREPDLRTPDEVFEYLTRLKEILLYTGVSDCNMEEGSLRCDANVSVMLKGAKQFGTKAEVKNVNSFRFIRSAVEYEIERQIGVIEDGGRVVQESRLWNCGEGRTYSMRSKEQAHDYRYFPGAGPSAARRWSGVAGEILQKHAGASGGSARAHDRRVRDQQQDAADAHRDAGRMPTSLKRLRRRRRVPSAWLRLLPAR